MILSDSAIRKLIETGQITVDPEPDEDQYDTSSLDLRLGSEFYRYRSEFVNPAPGVEPPIFDPANFDFQKMTGTWMERVKPAEDGSIILAPNDFMLSTTLESIYLPIESGIAARIEGRSTLARIGQSVHLTAPTVQIGWRGRLTLEIKNHGLLRIRLRPGMNICQLILERVEGQPSKDIGTGFQDQISPRGRE